MAEKSIIISAEEEAILLKPIDEYVGKIQEQIDALRVEGSDKVNSLKNQIAIAKENKNLTKEEQNKIIGECKKNLEKAKATEDANKQQIAKLIADAEGFLSKLYEKVSQMDESSLTAWIVQMSETISEKLKCARNSSARRLIVEAQNIVQERYMEADISLDEVCAVLGVSNSYFSSVFKKEAGKSFISYLTDYRMDIAAEMILNTDEKSYTIAEKVGYLDANYFSYVFKKKFGVSPSKYRASVK